MAQLDFLLSGREQERLVRFLVGRGVGFVPSLDYGEPTYEVLTSSDEVLPMASSGRMTGPLFVVSSEFTSEPLGMDLVEKGGRVVHFVVPRVGGPSLDFLPVQNLEDKDPPLLISGFVAHYPTYWLGRGLDEVAAPAGLRRLYRATARFLRSMCIPADTQVAKRRYWVGPDARAALLSGWASNAAGLVVPA